MRKLAQNSKLFVRPETIWLQAVPILWSWNSDNDGFKTKTCGNWDGCKNQKAKYASITHIPEGGKPPCGYEILGNRLTISIIYLFL